MYDRYKISRGESLKSIADKFNTRVDILKSINNLYYTDNLREGLEIIVPSNNNQYYNYYIVEKGDSLYKVAQKYNINSELLAALNGLDSDDYIYPNQELLIPSAKYSYYITKEGDTLTTVSDIFSTSKTDLLKINPTIYLLEGQLIAFKKD